MNWLKKSQAEGKARWLRRLERPSEGNAKIAWQIDCRSQSRTTSRNRERRNVCLCKGRMICCIPHCFSWIQSLHTLGSMAAGVGEARPQTARAQMAAQWADVIPLRGQVERPAACHSYLAKAREADLAKPLPIFFSVWCAPPSLTPALPQGTIMCFRARALRPSLINRSRSPAVPPVDKCRSLY